MATFTSNYNLEKPEPGQQDGVWGETVNENFDLIDAAIGVVANNVTSLTSTVATNTSDISSLTSTVANNTSDISTLDSEAAKLDTSVSFSDVTSDSYRSGVYSLTGTIIDPLNGQIQSKTISADTTFTESLQSGDSVILRLTDAENFVITFPTLTWVGIAGNKAPTFSTKDIVILYKIDSTLYASYAGSFV